MFDIVGVVVLVGLTVALGWLARRAWRSTRRVLKWVGATFCGLLALVVGTALVVALVGYYKLNRKYDNPVAQISVEVTPELVARGGRAQQHLMREPRLNDLHFINGERLNPLHVEKIVSVRHGSLTLR